MPNVTARGKKFQLTVKHKLLPKPYYDTFESEAEAKAYGDKLESLLAKGILPEELKVSMGEAGSPRMVDVIDDYVLSAPVTDSDARLLNLVGSEVVGVTTKSLTYAWVEAYVRTCKVQKNLAPGSIRKRVGVLARVMDWHLTKTVQNKSGNPLRMLPRGYSTYSGEDVRLLPKGVEARQDVKRDRRILSYEIEDIRSVLRGESVDRPTLEFRKGRSAVARGADPTLSALFELILGTGLRLLEAYSLRADQVDLRQAVIRVDGSKGHRGLIKPRTVPLTKPLRLLLGLVEGKKGRIFPYWDGDKESRRSTSAALSVMFSNLFALAGVQGATEHDIRHTACCQWFEMRRPDGAWTFSDVEICKIMGWSNYDQVLRYASLRGEDLSKRLD